MKVEIIEATTLSINKKVETKKNGDVIDVPDAQGETLVRSGVAKKVASTPTPSAS